MLANKLQSLLNFPNLCVKYQRLKNSNMANPMAASWGLKPFWINLLNV